MYGADVWKRMWCILQALTNSLASSIPATLVQLDRLGFMVQVTRLGQSFKLRLPFPRAAADRKDVKTLIVEMTQAAMSNPEVQAAMEEKMAAEAKEEATA